MKNKLILLNSKDNKLNGLLSFLVVLTMVLGCTCNKDFSLDDKGDDSRTQREKPSSTNDRQSESRTNIPADDSGLDVLNPDTAQAIVKNTFADFIEGVEQNDFSTLRENASSEFKNSITTQKLAYGFKFFTDNKDSSLSILQQIDNLTATMNQPELSIKGATKTIQLKGIFPTKPSVTSFDFQYILEDGYWRIFRVNVKLGN